MVVNMYLDVGAEGWEIEGAGRTGVRMVTVAGNGDCGAYMVDYHVSRCRCGKLGNRRRRKNRLRIWR